MEEMSFPCHLIYLPLLEHSAFQVNPQEQFWSEGRKIWEKQLGFLCHCLPPRWFPAHTFHLSLLRVSSQIVFITCHALLC